MKTKTTTTTLALLVLEILCLSHTSGKSPWIWLPCSTPAPQLTLHVVYDNTGVLLPLFQLQNNELHVLVKVFSHTDDPETYLLYLARTEKIH